MNITQLKYFQAVAAYHTVSLAAQHLYISQPSISNAIKALEKDFSKDEIKKFDFYFIC